MEATNEHWADDFIDHEDILPRTKVYHRNRTPEPL